MEPAELRDRVASLRTWRRGERRAPHKPLVLLYALGRLQRGEPRLAPFVDIYGPLRDLLGEFTSPRPEYPYWRLQNDGVWEVQADRPLRSRMSNTDPPKSELEASKGGLSEETVQTISRHPRLLAELTHLLLDAHFPETLHNELLRLVGIDLVSTENRPSRLRDPRFRQQVLQAYEYRCGVCGYDGRLGNTVVGLEAAHVRWHQFFGPDEIENGVALCSLHHNLLDRGALSIQGDWTVAVSQVFVGRSELAQSLIQRAGDPILGPQVGQPRVSDEHLEWHFSEVFRTPARASIESSRDF